MSGTNEVSRSEFARLLGVKPGYVTQLQDSGRLVLTDDGKRVRVAESRARIEATRDPSKQGVADRHAAARGQTTGPRVEGAGGDAPDLGDEAPESGQNEGSSEPGDYQGWRAMKERYLALAAKRDFEVSMKKLMDRDRVVEVTEDVALVLQATMEGWVDIYSPQLATISDENEIRTLLFDAVEQALEEIANKFAKLAKADDGE